MTTSGVVIAVLSDGFYVENAQSDWDDDICTAERIYVYTPTGVPSDVVLGYELTATGVVAYSTSALAVGSHAITAVYPLIAPYAARRRTR